MKNKPSPIEIPYGSRIHEYIHDASFYDAYEVPLHGGEKTAMQIYLDVFSRTPAWVSRLMDIRNRIVELFGLKNLGAMGAIDPGKSASSYKTGDRAGIFSLQSLSEDEVIFAETDTHLDVKVSVYKYQKAEVNYAVVTTVVHIHNLLGRIYMLFVAPVHKLIAPAMLAKIAGEK